MEKLLSAKQAYSAMFLFLERYYDLTAADDVGALLGSMSILSDGYPMDSAMWEEWLEVIAVTSNSNERNQSDKNNREQNNRGQEQPGTDHD